MKSARVSLFLCLLYGFALLLCIPVGVAHAHNDEWDYLDGPRAHGGVVNALIVAPSQPDTLFTIVDGGPGQRLFRSDDGAISWRRIITLTGTLSGTITSLAVDALNPETIYAGSSGSLFLSSNGGISWSTIYTMGAAISLASSTHIYVADKIGEPDDVCKFGYFGVATSKNKGQSWSVMPVGCAQSLPFLTTHPQNANLVYIGGSDDKWGVVFRSTNGGATFTSLPLGSQFAHQLQDLLLLPTQPAKLFVSDEYGIIQSQDGGDNWTRLAGGHIGSEIPSHILPEDPFELTVDSAGVIYAIDKFTTRNGVTIYRSDDTGQTWWSALQRLPNGARTLVAHPQLAGRLFVGLDGFGIWTTTTKGGSWKEQNAGITSIVQIESLAVPLNDPSILFAGSTYGARPGLYQSTNGGLTWTTVLSDTSVRAVAVHPLTPTIAFAGTETDLWATNDGNKWYPSNVSQLVNGIAISKSDPRGWYAIGVKHPYDSAPSGTRLAEGRFLRFNPGNPSQGEGSYWLSVPVSQTLWAHQLAIDPIDSQIVYSGVTLDPYDAIYRSTNRGENWVQIHTIASRMFNELLIDERFPRRIYVTSPAGIDYSFDQGNSWSSMMIPRNPSTYAVTLDNSGNLCAGTDDGVWCQDRGLWYSTGLKKVWIRELVSSVASNGEQWMYAGTASGVWRRKFPKNQPSETWLPIVQK